jgi:5-methylcytosine-specific restriction endonuclease McrA
MLERAVLVSPDAHPEPLRVKIDPGSRVTGLALVDDRTGWVGWAGEVRHRWQRVRDALLARRAIRRGRWQRHTRYRAARCANRRRAEGWLPPSLESRLSNILTWVAHLRRYAPVGAISQELVRFDTQLLEHPDISGVEYQQGTLAGYEVREYLLEKWRRRCAYCKQTDLPLQIEHLTPRSRRGSNRISNLTLACKPCNVRKGTLTAAEFGFPDLQAHAKQPLRDAAAVNASRWARYRRLQATGLRVEAGTGGQTKWNRTQRGLPKAHWIDAACVGASTPPVLRLAGVVPLVITATGHGVRPLCGTDRCGFPTRHRTQQTRHFDFATGDLVRAAVPAGLKTAGRHVGRVLVRASGSFDLATATGRVQGISYRYCQEVALGDGYAYCERRGGASSPVIDAGEEAPPIL